MHLNLFGLELMPTAKYKLVYLNLRGKGPRPSEPFEDHRENYLEFAKGKDQFPMPRLPKLIVDGKLECATPRPSSPMGRKHGLDGETDEERAICDVLGARISEYMNPSEALDELTETVFNTCVQKDFGPVFERQLEVNNSGYLVGDKLTWIDFYGGRLHGHVYHVRRDRINGQVSAR
ncbi:hypothetical protein M3Y99_00544000 [Aphelenchoides fujianensis]|nr:hypothetical protein M3Y99_00544000 [Aphelenchoides fujianensis]